MQPITVKAENKKTNENRHECKMKEETNANKTETKAK